MNGDGKLDVLVGNDFPGEDATFSNEFAANQLLLGSDRSGSFSAAVDLPGGSASTYALAVADVNGDGKLDVLVGNHGAANQLLPFRVCDHKRDGVRLHAASWCFDCPDFMGRCVY